MSFVDEIRNEYQKLITIEDIKSFTVTDLKKEDVYNSIIYMAVDPLYTVEPGKAANLLFELENIINSDKSFLSVSPKIYNKYQNVLSYLKFNSLFLVPADEIEKLFEERILFAFEWELDLFQIINNLFNNFYYDVNTFNPVRKAMLRGMEKNKEKIGGVKIILDDKEEEQTIRNWIRDYNYFFELRERKITLDEVTYINRSENIRRLKSNKEKKILSQVIKVYNFLWRPIEAETGLETGHKLPKEPIEPPSEAKNFFKEGEKVTPDSEVQQEVIAAYQGDQKQVKAITKEQEKLNKKLGSNNAALWEEFFKAVQKKNLNRTIAILRVLTDRDDLENFLRQDAKLNKFLTTIWQKQYGEDFVAEFNQNPAQLKFVRQFLRYVLEERLGMNSSDAARIGLQIGNIFVSLGKKSYNKMAYFDVNNKQFNWFED